MIKAFPAFLAFLFLAVAAASAQPPAVKMKTDAHHPDGYTVYVSNPEWYPVTVRVEWKNTNLDFSDKDKAEFLVPARQDHYVIGELKPAEAGKGYKLNYRYFTTMGDLHAKPQADYVYDLPYGKGAAYLVFQGYNGTFSHAGEYALDFTMPEGTQVRAVRGGRVVQVVQNNNRQCSDPSCIAYNNFVTVLHSDGSMANYAHLRENGAAVSLGDTITTGNLIGYSGNTGYTNGPHLHLVIFTGSFEKWHSFPTKFRTGTGADIRSLRQGETWARSY